MSTRRPPERTLWSGRPALRLLLLSPLFLGPAAGAAWLARRAFMPGRLPDPEFLFRFGWESLRLLNAACAELAGALMIALTLTWIVASRLATRYELTTQRLRLRSGLLVRVVDEIELYRVRDVRLVRGPLQLLSGLGTITVDSSEGTGTVRLGPLANPVRVREAIREASEAHKERLGMRLVA